MVNCANRFAFYCESILRSANHTGSEPWIAALSNIAVYRAAKLTPPGILRGIQAILIFDPNHSIYIYIYINNDDFCDNDNDLDIHYEVHLHIATQGYVFIKQM